MCFLEESSKLISLAPISSIKALILFALRIQSDVLFKYGSFTYLRHHLLNICSPQPLEDPYSP